MTALSWLPPLADWRPRLRSLIDTPATAWTAGMALANTRLDFVRTNALDQAVRQALGGATPEGLATRPVRLAVLGSSTLAHLQPAIRVAGLRRNIHVEVYENDYGQYLQELSDPSSARMRSSRRWCCSHSTRPSCRRA